MYNSNDRGRKRIKSTPLISEDENEIEELLSSMTRNGVSINASLSPERTLERLNKQTLDNDFTDYSKLRLGGSQGGHINSLGYIEAFF